MTAVRIEKTWLIIPKDKAGPSITYFRDGRSHEQAREAGIQYLRETYPEVRDLPDDDFWCVPRDWEMGPVLEGQDSRRQC